MTVTHWSNDPMTRTLPHHYIERASRPEPGSACDDELRHRCRSAPIWIRRTMNARREERGLPPLWLGVAKRSAAASASRRVRFLKAFLVANGHRG